MKATNNTGILKGTLELPVRQIQRLHWPLSWGLLLVMVIFHLIWGQGADWQFDLMYAAVTVLCQIVARQNSKNGIALHLVVTMALVYWYTHNLEAFPQRLGVTDEAYATLMAPLVFGLGLHWGAAGFVMGTAIGVMGEVNPTPTERLIVMFLMVFVAAMGWLFNTLLQNLYQAQEELAQVSLQDPLTGLGNRVVFENDFSRYRGMTQRSDVPLMLTVWDIDDLSTINDRQGRDKGDQTLKDFAGSLRLNVRESDGVYRIGGDQFAGLHPQLTEATVLLARVRAVFPKVSVGWSQVTGNLDDALKEAEARLQEARVAKA
jgi:diguanylate cyclase (GGDEF)-like protein